MPSLIALAICTLTRRITRINWQGPLTAGDRHTCREPDRLLNTWCARHLHHAGPHDDHLGCIWTPHARSHIIDHPNATITIHGEPA